jgi:DNA-binding transcriptional MocR family regulator
MNELEQYQIAGTRASEIGASIETAVREGRLAPGARLPAVRDLAAGLGVSSGTVAAVYQRLRDRGLVVTAGRNGTRIARRPPLPAAEPPPPPAGVRDLASGNPDPALLPPLGAVLQRLDPPPHLYAEQALLPELARAAARELRADGIAAPELAVVGGAHDGIERALVAHLAPGDRVVVEDPGYPRTMDLLAALGLVAVPVPVDDAGPDAGALDAALARGAAAVVLTPRAQNPTGAALTPERAADLRAALDPHPDVLVLEDDHAGAVAGAAALTVCDRDRRRWAVIRSVGKALGPDLRLAVMTGSPETVGRVAGRQLLGTGWVSHLLQGVVAALAEEPATAALLARAAAAYAERRAALRDALAARGIEARGRSGMNVWVGVRDEARTTASLLDAGWAVVPGERYRLRAAPAVRITVSTLLPHEAPRLADDLARALVPAGRTAGRTYAG